MYKAPLSFFSSPEAEAFYTANANARLSDLLLKYGHDDPNRDLSLHLDARKKAQRKIPTWYKTKGIVFPQPQFLEQASSEATAIYKAQLFDFNTSADLTGGTGIDSWQFALQAKSHVYVEPNDALSKLASHNFEIVGLKNTAVVNSSAEEFLAQLREPLDLIYLDPSRRAAHKRLVNLEDYSPNVPELLPELLRKCRNLLVKVSPLADIKYLTRQFKGHLKAIYVVASGNECKEIILHCTPLILDNVPVHAVNLGGQANQRYTFRLEDEQEKADFAKQPLAYLYEPNAAVLKAGAFNSLTHAYGVQKLHPNSHLYTSNVFKPNFPGRAFSVLETCKPYKMSQVFEPINVAARNFPDKAEAIQKKLGLKQGADYRLFATTTMADKVFIIGKEVTE
jgi:hypothetical protein